MFVGPGDGVLVGPGVGVALGPGVGVEEGPGVGVFVGVNDGPGVEVGVTEGARTIKVFLQALTEGFWGNVSSTASGFDSGTFGATGFVPRLFILITINTDETAKIIVEIIIIIVKVLFFILFPNSVYFYKRHHFIRTRTANGIRRSGPSSGFWPAGIKRFYRHSSFS